jgi:hypothetical protein
MKKLTIVAMVVIAAILIASPVLAAGSSHPMEVAKQGPKKKPTSISMTATIKIDRVDAATNTGRIYVGIQMTNKAFIQYRGDEEWVKITRKTACIEWLKATKSRKIKCSDLVDKAMDDGRMVSIYARVKDGEFIARRVQISQPRVP